jgi:uncharacterized protein (DUF488 family)
VDVRELPLSRKKGFAKKALSNVLQEAGIEYLHFKPLGCPKPIRDRLKRDGRWQNYVRDFSQHLAQQAESLIELIELAQHNEICLLCFEADYQRCHRSLVAKAAQQRCHSLDISHITFKTVIPERVIQEVA